MTEPTPQAEHDWLHQMVGEWTYTGECSMGPDQPPMTMQGSDSVRSLGGFWTVAEGTGTTPGPGIMLTTLGYDPIKKKYVGSFAASMMTHLWIYEGERDANGVLVLESDGPSFTDPTIMVTYRDLYEIKSKDERSLTSLMPGPDGTWIRFMTMTYKRKG